MRLPAVVLLLAAGGWLALAAPAWGDLPSPRLDRVVPLGIAAGGTTTVELLAADVEDALRLVFDHPGLTAEYVGPKKFKVSAAADVPQGTYDMRLVGRYGISNPRLFQVTHRWTVLAEKEKNNTSETAQAVDVNSVLDANSDSNDVDIFSFTAAAGQRITIDCLAGRLDSQLDGVMALSNAAGQTLASSSDYFGRDPFLDFVAPAAGKYFVTVNDLSYRGGFPYRLVIADTPQVENIEPRALTADVPTEVTAFGRNFGAGSQRSAWQVGDLPLEQLRFSVTAPADLLARGAFRFIDHPVDFSVLPTAATCTLTGYQILPPLGDCVQRPQTMLVTPDPVVLESEPNDQPEKAQAINLPAVVSGRFHQSRDVDIYEFDTGDGGNFAFEVYCERIGGRADPYLVVQNTKGDTIVEGDDYGHRASTFDGHLRDPVVSSSLGPKQRVRVLVADRYSRGGARLQYVLTVHRSRPDFYVAATHRQSPGPAGLSLSRGGAEWLELVIHRRDGQTGPVAIHAEDLPPGVHAARTLLHNTANGAFVLWADPDAAPAVKPIRLVAEGTGGEQELVRDVRPYTRVWSQQNLGSSRPTRELVLAVGQESAGTEPSSAAGAPLRVTLEPATATVEAGKSLQLKALATRYWPEAKNEIRLAPLAFPNNLQLAETVLPAGAAEVMLTIKVQPKTPPGDYTLAVQCQSQVPFDKDPQAATRPNNLMTFPSLPATITVTEPPKP